MTMNSSGPISLGGATTGQSINLEVGSPATSTVSLNDPIVRTLAGETVISSEIVMPTDFYGKSIASGYAMFIRYNPNRPASYGDGSRTNVLKQGDNLIVQFYNGGSQSFPTGTYIAGESATIRVDDNTGTILWTDNYTYANATGPGTGTAALQTSRMGIDPTGTNIYQYDTFTSNRPPVNPIQGVYTNTRIIKNFSNGVPTSFNMAPNVFGQTTATGFNFANGNTIISYGTTPTGFFSGAGQYIQSPPGATVGPVLKFSSLAPATGRGFGGRFFYADNTTKTDVITAYSCFNIPPGASGSIPPPGNGSRNFTAYCRTTQDATIPYARWIANGSFLPGTQGAQEVLASPPALSYHVGIKNFNANFPNLNPQNTNNLLFWKYNKSDGAFTGNVFYWSNQPTTPPQTSTNPFSNPSNLFSSHGPSGKFLTIGRANYTTPTTWDVALRFFDSTPTFNNSASYIATGRDGGTVVPTNNFTGGIQFEPQDHNSENFGNTIFEDGDFMYLIFSFRVVGETTTTPWDVCILKTKKDGSGITDGLTVTSPTLNKSITFTTLTNRPLYETPGWIGGTLDTTYPTTAFPGWNLTAPRVNMPATTFTSQKIAL